MDSLFTLLREPSAAHDVLLLALVAFFGLTLGSLKVKGLGLGIAGVLFAGLVFGHYGLTASHETIDFVRDLGLILFVYAVGVQVGPGFLSSLKQQGLTLNVMAGAIVILGALTTLFVSKAGGVPMAVAAGLFSGATTNTPSLAAAQGALLELPDAEKLAALPGLGYAVSYPFGVLGIILTMLLIRAAFGVNVAREVGDEAGEDKPALQTLNLEVNNPNLDGIAIRELPRIKDSGIVVSRVKKGDLVEVARADTRVETGDVLLAVGEKHSLEEFQRIVGPVSEVDLREIPADLTTRRLILTRRQVLAKSVHELNWAARFGVVVTRVVRAGLQLAPRSNLRLQFGDTLLCVGGKDGLTQAAAEAGDSHKELEHPALLPVFVGIALGVLLGSFPFAVPGVPAPIKLGMAGGPLLAAIGLSALGRIGPLVWHLPHSANAALREFGIILFLGATGMKAGSAFVPAFANGDGLQWMAWGALITLVPLIVIALVARIVFKLKFASLCGLLAGSTTDPPALAFANSMTASDTPLLAYATVYPLVMILRIVAAQILVLFFAR